MTFSKKDFDAIIADESKIILGDISWSGDDNSPTRSFRIDIQSRLDSHLFVDGFMNTLTGKLSYSIIHRMHGRIYGLDLGKGHVNPDGQSVGETHKNYWEPLFRDRWAYVPEDITKPWFEPVEVWREFCEEAHITHSGEMSNPTSVQARLDP